MLIFWFLRFSFLSILLSVFGERKSFFFRVWLFACLVLRPLYLTSFTTWCVIWTIIDAQYKIQPSLVFLINLNFREINCSLLSIASTISERHSGACPRLCSKRVRSMDGLLYCFLAGLNWSNSKTINEAEGRGAAYKPHCYCSRGWFSNRTLEAWPSGKTQHRQGWAFPRSSVQVNHTHAKQRKSTMLRRPQTNMGIQRQTTQMCLPGQ